MSKICDGQCQYYLSREEADVFPLDVFAKCHLKQCQSHVKSLDDVTLPRQRMVPPGRLATRHLTLKLLANLKLLFKIKNFSFYLDCLESDQHLALQSLKSGVQSCGTEFIESTGDPPHGWDLLVAHVLEDLDQDLGGQLHQGDLTTAAAASWQVSCNVSQYIYWSHPPLLTAHLSWRHISCLRWARPARAPRSRPSWRSGSWCVASWRHQSSAEPPVLTKHCVLTPVTKVYIKV